MENKSVWKKVPSVDELEEMIYDMIKKKEKEKENLGFICTGGKSGAIKYLTEYFIRIGCSKEIVKERIDFYQKELREGLYKMGPFGIKYLGKVK